MSSNGDSASKNSDTESDSESRSSDDHGAVNYLEDHDLEPLATEEEAAAFQEESQRENEEQEELLRRFNRDVSVSSWYNCSRCSLEFITKPEECRCCREFDRCMEKLDLLEDNVQRTCITEHEAFSSVCLNRWVLEVAGLSLKTKSGQRYSTMLNQGRRREDEFFRAVSYRQFIRLVWDYIGRSQRIPLPCCSYNAIRSAFRSGNDVYRGYETDEGSDNE